MKKLIIIALTLMLASCSSTYNLSTDYRIKSILTIAESGDTIAVPIRDFKFRVLDSRVREIINREQFRFRQNWYPGNYNGYPMPYVSRRSSYNRYISKKKPFIVKPIKSKRVIKVYKPYKPMTTIPKLKPIKK
jgi:hypothetical protein